MSETEAAPAAAAPTTEEVENAEKENVNAAENANVAEANKEENKDSKEESADKTDEFKWQDAKNIAEFTVKDIDGNEVSMSKYIGHPTLIVNVASNCGFTKNNYEQLNQLYEKYEAQGLRIAAFPCNQFMGQEPACDVDIKEFMKKKGVQFDMYCKVDVNGDNAIPLYKWLKTKQRGILGFNGIKWNFTKFLVDKEGLPIKRFAPTTSPNSIEPDIKALLA